MKILCASRTANGAFYVWVGELLLRWGDVDYVGFVTSGVGADPSGLRSFHLHNEDFTNLVVVAKEGEQE